jgi:predicted  nucleic acid-binding Zn-ribbon protein
MEMFKMLEYIFTPELTLISGILACGIAVLTLVLAGRSAYTFDLATRLSTLEIEIGERKKTLNDMGIKLAETELLQSKADSLEKRIGALQQDLRPMEEKHLKAVSDYEDVKGNLRQVKDEWLILSEKVEIYKVRVSQLDNLEQEIKALEERRNQIEVSLGSFADRQRDLECLNQSIEKQRSEVTDLEKWLKDLKHQSAEAKEQLETTLNNIADAEKELKRRQEEMERLENVKIDLDARLDTLSDKLKSVGRMPPEAFDSLKLPVFEKSNKVKSNADEQSALEALNNLVEYCGFEIPRRLQDAFHTALKTSDISCLTVMAGVSGTGKSAFPKLYSEAMGMYFLPLAVEPRWDSPQDLFGFLNYMENRFEATRLGRALVQFNNSPHANRTKTSMNDRLLLVLLDEMNLARIEYYFSEFLSKLEMRRNADTEREADYQMVSVEVFAGHAASDGVPASPPVRLYAGRNVLFVGTMNEDESTQSLSDKVIDRANVLYFGRPNNLRDKKQQILTTSEWAAMNASQWQSWIVDPGVETIPDYDRVDSIINSVNQSLALLGRPFGWRTYKAVKAYVANHPAVLHREDNGMRPLSDQIAMRVMPKLRGIDLNEHGDVFSALGQTLRKIDDPALQQAFDKASQSTQGYFDWRGINWA